MMMREIASGAMAALNFMALAAVGVEPSSFAFNPHGEFPGAKGSLVQTVETVAVNFDFSRGGHGVSADWKFPSARWIDGIRYEVLSKRDDTPVGFMIKDASGQVFCRDMPLVTGRWTRCSARFGSWKNHFGGANDGVVHQPISSLMFTVGRRNRGKPGGPVGSVFFRRIELDEIADVERVPIPVDKSVPTTGRVVLTDFGEPTEFNPREWWTDGSFSNGTWLVNFARREAFRLVNSVDIPIEPEELILSLEASAEAAGAQLTVVIANEEQRFTNAVARIRSPLSGEKFVRQTMVFPTACHPTRIDRIEIRREGAARRPVVIRLLELEAVGKPGVCRPALTVKPPSGDCPPSVLRVEALNATSRALGAEGEVAVSLCDWNGNSIGTARVPVPLLRSGERRAVSVDLPPVDGKLNYVGYRVEWRENGRRAGAVRRRETSWTRPLDDAVDPVLRPDLPWGMVCGFVRTEPWTRFNSAYEVDKSPDGIARMKDRITLAARCGVKWERGGFETKFVHPASNRWDWAYYDALVDTARANGISVYGCLDTFPRWTRYYTEGAYAAFVETARACAQRYKGRVAAWEIWNEPNVPHFWRGPKAEYFALAKRTLAAIREVDPDVTVIGCSAARVDFDFIREFLEAVPGVDISVHTYRTQPWEESVLDDIRSLSELGGGCGVWISETGWNTGAGWQSCEEQEQAAFLVRTYLTSAAAEGIRAINGYDFIDDGFNPGNREERFGIVRRDLTPKPACRAVAQVFRFFTSGQPKLSAEELSGGSKVWTFRMGGRSAVWCDRETPVRLSVRPDGGTRILNLMGERLEGDAISVDSTHPVFIDGGCETHPLADLIQQQHGKERK